MPVPMIERTTSGVNAAATPERGLRRVRPVVDRVVLDRVDRERSGDGR
jgi:hypothetical protein